MDINVLVQKLNSIENIANAIIQATIVLIVIVKIVLISPRRIHIVISVRMKMLQKLKKVKKFALVLKADVIKIIANVLKVGINALLYVDV